MNYQAEKSNFLKIYVNLPKYLSQLRTLFEKETVLYQKKSGVFSEVTFESGLPFNMRFMVDNQINGMSWIGIDPDQYILRDEKDKISTCQIELDVFDYRNVKEVQKTKANIAPLRIMSFDIEVSTDGVKFPTPGKCPVI